MNTNRPCGFRASEDVPLVTITLDGRTAQVPAQASVAAALLAAGADPFRTTAISQSPRAPYCMMGVCFECLVEIDGRPNRQACLEPVTAGMQVRTQQGARLFPAGEQEAGDER